MREKKERSIADMIEDELENGSEHEPHTVDTPTREDELEKLFFARGDRWNAMAESRTERLSK